MKKITKTTKTKEKMQSKPKKQTKKAKKAINIARFEFTMPESFKKTIFSKAKKANMAVNEYLITIFKSAI